MPAKEVDVVCPSCASRLSVDVLTARVLRWRKASEAGERGGGKVTEGDWDTALGRVEGRLGQGEDRFDASLHRERRRSKDLDALFDELKDKSAGEPGDAEGNPGEDSQE